MNAQEKQARLEAASKALAELILAHAAKIKADAEFKAYAVEEPLYRYKPQTALQSEAFRTSRDYDKKLFRTQIAIDDARIYCEQLIPQWYREPGAFPGYAS